MRRPRLAQIWDIVAVLLLLPVVVLMGSQLPGDWQRHSGSALAGTATVVAVEPVRVDTHILVDVSDEAGRVVATHQEVNGDAPHVLGAKFDVAYLPPDEEGETQAYAQDHDPFITNLLVFTVSFAVLLAGLLRLGVRLWRLARRRSSRSRPQRKGPYQAGYGYTRT